VDKLLIKLWIKKRDKKIKKMLNVYRKEKESVTELMVPCCLCCVLCGVLFGGYDLEQITKDGQKKGGIAPAFVVIIIYLICFF
jgi:hypothetical protein